MSQTDLLEAFRLIDQNEDLADFEGPKPPALVRKAEEALGVALPESYRQFLERYGCGDIAGVEFYGLIGSDFENSSVPDAIWLTLREREDSALPGHFVIVHMEGDGTYSVLDCSAEGPDQPVLARPPGASPDDELAVLAEDYSVFLRERLAEAL